MACPVWHFERWWWRGPADVEDLRAARDEGTVLGRCGERRRSTRYRVEMFVPAIEAWKRGQESVRVWVQWPRHHVLYVTPLDQPAGVHHGYVISDLRHYAEAVCHEKDGRPSILA